MFDDELIHFKKLECDLETLSGYQIELFLQPLCVIVFRVRHNPNKQVDDPVGDRTQEQLVADGLIEDCSITALPQSLVGAYSYKAGFIKTLSCMN